GEPRRPALASAGRLPYSRVTPHRGISGFRLKLCISHTRSRPDGSTDPGPIHPDRPGTPPYDQVASAARLAPMRTETSPIRKIVVLAGGIGGARFLRGLMQAAPDADITVIGNTGDDISLFGLRVCPDLDTVMYTLGGGINEEQGWGRAGESFAV